MKIALNHELRGSRLTLRRLVPDDAQAIQDIWSDWRVARMLRQATYPPRLGETTSWLSRHEEDWLAGRAYRFGLTLEGRLIGCADIADIDQGTGVLGYWVENAHWGRGFGSEAAGLMHGFAQETLGLLRLKAGHAIENNASGRILLRLGFKPMGDTLLPYYARREMVPYRRYVLELTGKPLAADSATRA